MGNTFEVWSWEKDESGNYSCVQAYAGENYQEAIATMHELKNTGVRYRTHRKTPSFRAGIQGAI